LSLLQEKLRTLQEIEEFRAVAHQIDSSVLYSQRNVRHGTLYTPRLVLLDAKGSLGSFQQPYTHEESTVSPLEHIASTWQGPSEVHHKGVHAAPDASRKAQPHSGQENFEGNRGSMPASEKVNFFTDYLQSSLHPRTVHLVDGIWHGNDDSNSPWMQPDGWLSPSHGLEEISDMIRTFAEDADTLAGFQCIVDDFTLWGGIASEVLEMVKDDYRAQPVLLYATRKNNAVSRQVMPAAMKQHLQLARGLSNALLTRYTDVFVPLMAPEPYRGDGLVELQFNTGNDFQKSGLFAAAIDSMSTPYRLNNTGGAVGGIDMWSLPELLRGQFTSPFASLSIALPCATLPDILEKDSVELDQRVPHNSQRHPSPLFTSKVSRLSGLEANDGESYAESIVLRGARSKSESLLVHEAQELLDFALISEGRRRCVQHRVVSSQPLPVPQSMLNLFTEWTRKGDEPIQPIKSQIQIECCPLLTRLAGTSSFKELLEQSLQEWVAVSKTGEGHTTLLSWGVDDQFRGEVEEQLGQLAHAYEDE
jgi:hypothetical protein